MGSTCVAVPPELGAALDALDAAVATIGEVNLDNYGAYAFAQSEAASASVRPEVICLLWIHRRLGRRWWRWWRLWCIGGWIRWRRCREHSRRIRRAAETGRRIRRDAHCGRGYSDKQPRRGDLPDVAADAG
jgi:hypothetical protein